MTGNNNHRIIIDEGTLQSQIAAAARKIRQTYPTQSNLLILSVLDGAAPFASALKGRLESMGLRCTVAGIRASSYGAATVSSGSVTVELLEAAPLIPGSDVLLVDDIYDTGLTLGTLSDRIDELAPRSLRIAVMLRRLREHRRPINVDFVAADIDTDDFLAGFGLDYNGGLRNLPHIVAIDKP